MAEDLAGLGTEQSLEDVLVMAAALIATTSESAIRRPSRNDTIMVRKSVLLRLVEKINDASPGMVGEMRARLAAGSTGSNLAGGTDV